MEIHEGLEARTEGCKALLMDSGNGSSEIPTCMGAIGIDGANSTIVGCVQFEVCKDLITPIPGKVRIAHRDESGVVIGESDINKQRLAR